MRIGVMGGTFDPIHIGHLLLAEFAYEDFKLDEIWFLPNGNPPHKKTDESKKALAHRIKMIELAISDMPHFKIDLSEPKQMYIRILTVLCRNLIACIPNVNSILFWAQIHSLQSKSGDILRRFFRHVQFLPL